MGRKYIIEIIGGEEGDMDFSTIEPYTEPDLDAIHKEAYDKAFEDAEQVAESGKRAMYQKGLKDAWEAARKIASDNAGRNYSIFGQHFTVEILNTHSASECIEKIRQYEEKEEIRVGDEVEDGVANIIVLEINEDGTVSGFDDAGSIIHATPRKKTGRHFPEIAEVLAKMKE